MNKELKIKYGTFEEEKVEQKCQKCLLIAKI
jgi:hypothetical protein